MINLCNDKNGSVRFFYVTVVFNVLDDSFWRIEKIQTFCVCEDPNISEVIFYNTPNFLLIELKSVWTGSGEIIEQAKVWVVLIQSLIECSNPDNSWVILINVYNVSISTQTLWIIGVILKSGKLIIFFLKKPIISWLIRLFRFIIVPLLQ